MSVTSALTREQAIARILELTGQPEATGGRPWVVVMVGLPGSGKSTFSRRLASMTGAIVLESDALRAALFETPTHLPDESKQLFEALYGAAHCLVQAGASVIIDATNLREQDRQRAYDLAEVTGAEMLVLHFRVPERIIADRLTKRDSGGDPDDKSKAGLAVYAKLAETEEPVSREHWKIDTSDAAATEAALQRAIETLRPLRERAKGQNTGGSIS